MRRAGALLLLALALPAQADVLLDGAQHIGDSDSASLTPGDPVTRRQHFQSPTNFHLSSAIAVTGVQLNGLAGTVDSTKLRVRINGNLLTTSFSGETLTLSTLVYPVGLLLAGNRVHTIAIDPGCSGTTPGITSECSSGTGNDIGLTAITLKTNPSTGTTTSTNLAQRHHIGRNSGETNNYAGNFYPDAPECAAAAPATCTLTVSFTLSAPQRLTQLRIYRLRNIDTRAGAVAGTVALDGTTIGSLSANQNPFRINTNIVLFAGTHTLTFGAGLDRNGAPDDISFDDVHLLYTFDSSLVPGAYNAVDTNANGVSGRLQTKIAGSTFSVDLIALNAARDDVQASYSGTVRVELLDGSDNSGTLDSITGCRSSWSFVHDFGQYTFGGTGRQPQTFTYANALRSARFRITEISNVIQGCSTDVFSLRPDHFDLALANGPAAAGSYTSTSTPVHKAGQPFTVVATAAMASGTATAYDGQPTLVAGSSLLGLNVGVVSADNWTVTSGVAQSDNVRYSEAGALVLRASDSQFAAIDVDDTSLTGDADDAGRTASGEINAGRFIPDHFAFASTQAEFLPGCTNFTYAGQAFGFSLQPIGRITAEAFGGTPTTNYDSDSGLYKLPANLPQSAYSALGVTVDQSGVPADDNDVVEIGDGIAEVSLAVGTGIVLQRPTSPALPYDAEIQILLGALNEPDGVTFDATTPGRFGETTAGNGVPFLGGAATKQVRFGRAVVDNAHGSEKMNLGVPLRTEYWASVAGGAGFVTSAGDSCTAPPQSWVVLTPSAGLSTSVASMQGTGGTGVGSITLQAPDAVGYAGVRLDLSTANYSWLRGDWDNNGTWNDDGNDPSARASFGLFKQDERRIYQREMVGN